MTSIGRPPAAGLGLLIATVWAQVPDPGERSLASREHLLPSAATHLALRIGGPPLRVFDDAADRRGRYLGHAVVGGARAVYHVRDVSLPGASVGAVLRPGATSVLLGVPESALAGHHTRLDDLLPRGEVDSLLERLGAIDDAERRLGLFEHWLIGRAQGRPPLIHPAVARVLSRPDLMPARVEALVEASGLSHRYWIDRFREATGLAPRDWLRLRRFGRALELATPHSPAGKLAGWAEIAVASGFADQAHLTNTFRRVAGLTPTAWRDRVDPATPRHLPVDGMRSARGTEGPLGSDRSRVKSVQDKGAGPFHNGGPPREPR